MYCLISPAKLVLCDCWHAPHRIITIDRFLVQRVDKVARILYGVLDVTDGVCAAALTPHALLGCFSLVFMFTESGLLGTGQTNQKKKIETLKKKKAFQAILMAITMIKREYSLHV